MRVIGSCTYVEALLLSWEILRRKLSSKKKNKKILRRKQNYRSNSPCPPKDAVAAKVRWVTITSFDPTQEKKSDVSMAPNPRSQKES